MTPSPEFSVLPKVDDYTWRSRTRKEQNFFGELIKAVGFDTGPFGLFSEGFLIRPFVHEDFSRVAREAGIPTERIIDGLVVPRIFSGGEISWYSCLQVALRNQLENPKDKKWGRFLRKFGIFDLVSDKDGIVEAKLALRPAVKTDKYETLTIFLPKWKGKGERIKDLAAIAMVPSRLMRMRGELIIARPEEILEKGDYRYLSIRRGEDEPRSVHLVEVEGKIQRQGPFIFFLNFKDPTLYPPVAAE